MSSAYSTCHFVQNVKQVQCIWYSCIQTRNLRETLHIRFQHVSKRQNTSCQCFSTNMRTIRASERNSHKILVNCSEALQLQFSRWIHWLCPVALWDEGVFDLSFSQRNFPRNTEKCWVIQNLKKWCSLRTCQESPRAQRLREGIHHKENSVMTISSLEISQWNDQNLLFVDSKDPPEERKGINALDQYSWHFPGCV